MKKAYIAGKITGNPCFKKQFKEAENRLKEDGYIVLNPAELPEGMEYEDYMTICFAMIDAADNIFFLRGWEESQGAMREWRYSQAKRKPVIEFERCN